jgi:hypothetical protein
VILLLLQLVEAVPQRLSPASQKTVIMQYDKILKALMAAVANERGSSIFDQLSMCFLGILTQAEELGLIEESKRAIYDSFAPDFH